MISLCPTGEHYPKSVGLDSQTRPSSKPPSAAFKTGKPVDVDLEPTKSKPKKSASAATGATSNGNSRSSSSSSSSSKTSSSRSSKADKGIASGSKARGAEEEETAEAPDVFFFDEFSISI